MILQSNIPGEENVVNFKGFHWQSPSRLFCQYQLDAFQEIRFPLRILRGRRKHELWKRTCLELFLAGPEDCYLEFNFSPGGDFQVYHFSDYRVPGATPTPGVKFCRTRTWVSAGVLNFQFLIELSDLWGESYGHRYNPTAVIEAKEKGIGFWANAHPAEGPDFHNKNYWVNHEGS